MKKQLLLLAALGVAGVASAQTVTIKGSVKDINGNTLPRALVQDKSANIATRADSAGNFTLNDKPNSKLLITSVGYESKVVDVKDKTDIQVILTAQKGDAKNAPATPDQAAATPTVDFKEGYGQGGGMIYTSGVGKVMTSFKYVEATHGNRYLYNDWVTGYVVSPEDSIYKNPSYGFNYDKINSVLLLTQDKRTAVQVDQDRIKTFTLYDSNNVPATYEMVPDINKLHYVKVIATGKKFKIYKLTETEFVKNNYHTDGMTSTGNNYDEYVDNDTYYVVNVNTKQVQTFKLKKKSIKTAFAADADRVNSFFESDSDSIDDAYLAKMGAFLNQ